MSDQPEQVGGIPLWEEDIFAFLTKINEATEERPLTRVEATALVLSWMVTGLAKNVEELELLATEAEGPAKQNAVLIAECCGAMSRAMKVDIEASANASNRIIRAIGGKIPRTR